MQLKIWHKMIIGITIPSLIALLGTLFSYAYINNVKNRQSFVQIADDLKEIVLEIRRNEKNFFRYKEDEHLQDLHNAILIFNDSVNKIAPDIIEEIGKEFFSRLREMLTRYPALTEELHKNYQLEIKVTEVVRTEGRKLEAFAAEGIHAEDLSASFVLHLRLMEKNYMIFRNKESLIALERGLSQLRNITPFCYKCNPYIEAVHHLTATFEKSDAMENDLQDIGRNMQKTTGEIASLERKKISSFLVITLRTLLIAVILLCTLGPLFVYKTSDYIVAPIKRLSEITKKIADGDTTLRAPLREHDETYQLSMSFNTMLDQLQLTHQSLETSLNLLHEKQAQLVESEKRASLGLLVSGVAHELNNPINNISLTAETISEDLDELSNEELRDFIHDILRQSERAHDIVDNLLDFARARRSTIMEKQDIVHIVKDSFNLVANQLKVNELQLKEDLPDTALFVKGNRSKLEQVLVSIITNAIYAMKDGGTLSVTVTQDIEDNNILIKIHDTGPGIAEEDLKNIFEPFFTTKPVGDGTGLGLSVARSLVIEHQGELEVESKLGEGSTFIIKLPPYEAVS